MIKKKDKRERERQKKKKKKKKKKRKRKREQVTRKKIFGEREEQSLSGQKIYKILQGEKSQSHTKK